MYYNYMKFVIDKLKIHNNLKDDNFIPINEVVESINDLVIRPAITYGNNTDWSNLRTEETWILTMQIFVSHDNYLDLRNLSNEMKKTIIKYCCSTKIDDVIFSIESVSLNAQYESDYQSMSILITVNSKEVI